MSNMQTKRRRDSQQWILDWLVKETGRVQNFAYDERTVPTEVKSYKMIPRVLYKRARHFERLARAAEENEHTETAKQVYWKACGVYREAQHSIFEHDSKEKEYLHAKHLECYDKVISFTDRHIETVEIPWEGVNIQGRFHILDRTPAPTVLFLPGMDMTKEAFPCPFANPYVPRGFNVLSIDGPGQGISNIRKIWVSDDNYERAVGAAIDFLQARPEVDMTHLYVVGTSFGSHWGVRAASVDDRIKALATTHGVYGSKVPIFEEASPRFKQMFMYMSGIEDEDTFDEMASEMTTFGYGPQVTCPNLMVMGEYDPLCPLETALDFFDEIAGPKEMWVFENDFHRVSESETIAGLEIHHFLGDWLLDVMAGKIVDGHCVLKLVPKMDGLGPYSPAVRSFDVPGRNEPSE